MESKIHTAAEYAEMMKGSKFESTSSSTADPYITASIGQDGHLAIVMGAFFSLDVAKRLPKGLRELADWVAERYPIE